MSPDDLELCDTPLEREYLRTLLERARAWLAEGIEIDAVERIDDRLVVFVDVDDPDRGCVLRTLRVELAREGVLLGEDETMQHGPNLRPTDPHVTVVPLAAHDGRELAAQAAAWVERELARPIDRCEWRTPTLRHRRWMLVDAARRLCWSDSENQPRPELGEPTEVVRVRPST